MLNNLIRVLEYINTMLKQSNSRKRLYHTRVEAFPTLSVDILQVVHYFFFISASFAEYEFISTSFRLCHYDKKDSRISCFMSRKA